MFSRKGMGACIMRVCGNGPVAMRRGAGCIGAGRDFGCSLEANALVRQTSRFLFRYVAQFARSIRVSVRRTQLTQPPSRIFVPFPAIDAIGSADPARAIRHNEQPPSAADRLQPDSAPRISPLRSPCALNPPYLSSTSNENTPHCSRPQVSSSVSRTPHARASRSCTRRR